MKRADIRAQAEAHLLKVGFTPSSWRWQAGTAELHVIVNGGFAHLQLKSGMSRRSFEFAMGRVQGWADMLRLQPVQPVAHKPNGLAAAISPAA